MKKSILYLMLLLFTYSARAQWQWSKQIGGVGNDAVGAIYSNGYMYLSGQFVFNCHLDTLLLVSSGYNDWFIAKYDLSGTNLIWHKKIGNINTSSTEERGGIALITNNSIYCLGRFYNTLFIDGLTVTSNGGSDAFIAQFDLNGTCQWIKNAGGTGDDRPGGMIIDASGNIYWSIIIDSNNGGSFGTFNLTEGVALAKMDDTGAILTVKNNLVTGGYITSTKIHNNELYFAGVTENDSTIIDTDTLISNNVGDALLAKCSLNGSVIWSKRFGGNFTGDFASYFEFDANDNLYVVGRYRDSMTIDGNTVNCNGWNNYDMFLAKFNNNGTCLWIRNSYANTPICNAYANDIAKDSEGKFYVVGRFAGLAQFGTYSVSTTNTYDMFLARYDENGDCLGVRHFGKALGYGVEVDANDDVLVSGVFENTVTIGSNTFTSYGMQDGFIAKCDAITGIGEGKIANNNQLIIYANPNAGKCNITVPDDFLREKYLTLSIFDNTGKLIQQKTLEMNEGKIKVNLEQEAKGVYSVTLSSKKKSYSGRIVFE